MPQSASNAVASPLLRLPAELRNRIYELVIGGQMIHIHAVRCLCKEPKKYVVKYFIGCSTCKLKKSEFEIHSRWLHSNRSNSLDTWEHRHEKCEALFCNMNGSRTRIFDLSLLRTCKQLYYETRLLPYSTNTFSFRSPKAFGIWALNQLDVYQRAAVEKIRVEQDLAQPPEGRDQEWYDIFNEHLASHFPGLRTVHISFHVQNHQSPKIEEDKLKHFLMLRKLPLRQTTVTFHERLKQPPFMNPAQTRRHFLRSLRMLPLSDEQKSFVGEQKDFAKEFMRKLRSPLDDADPKVEREEKNNEPSGLAIASDPIGVIYAGSRHAKSWISNSRFSF
ncbi:hypothetical protein AOQ84DRAFT_442893 [Glonium stellatum]|uniref:DUF7730 domain-containing protein n=1 Tax=Glonium stellatum TaxID=574774 RepID=A0A8E2JN27_9PEZI|nr:hypothetical protein AOQ84DRAFT_442893 [Glonium stellatum]